MKILAIESSCDETSVAVIEDGKRVLSNCTFTQIDIHKEFGGVVPEIASRHHIEKITYIIKDAINKANVNFEDLDYIAVTSNPGLVGSLMVGINAAKTIGLAFNKPVIFVNVSGSCLNLSLQKEKCDAILQCFYPGAMGGLALADVIFGKVSPSGRLPVTFYESVGDLPPFEDYSMENRTYKFFKGEPLYPFGHGLTYTKITEKWIDKYTGEVSHSYYLYGKG